MGSAATTVGEPDAQRVYAAAKPYSLLPFAAAEPTMGDPGTLARVAVPTD